MAGNFLMEHEFSPRWTDPRPPRRETVRDSDEGHRRFSLDSFARLLHAFNTHRDEETGGEPPKVHPRFDLIEGPDDFKIYGNLPGMASDDLHVDVNDHLFAITVSGTFEMPREMIAAALQGKKDTVPINHKDAGPGPPPPGVGVEKARSTPTVEGKDSEEPEGVETRAAEAAAVTTGSPEESRKEEAKIKYHVHERKLGSFKREFRFPVEVVKMESVTAQCRNGLLEMYVPKNPTPVGRKGRKLDVV